MPKLITLQNGHTMYAEAFDKKVARIQNRLTNAGLNNKLMPLASLGQTGLKLDIVMSVENFCARTFHSILTEEERYQFQGPIELGDQTIVGLNLI